LFVVVVVVVVVVVLGELGGFVEVGMGESSSVRGGSYGQASIFCFN
jgi:hypothetical protein